jgi:hypothetical protein
VTPTDPALLDRLAALDAALRAAGHLGDAPAPIAALAYAPPAAVVPTWRGGPDGAAQALIDGWDWTPRTAAERARARAVELLAAVADESAQRDRAVVLVALDEVNDLRAWVTQFKAAVAAASSLADLKSRVAALPNLPQRERDQAKGAVATKIAAGGSD